MRLKNTSLLLALFSLSIPAHARNAGIIISDDYVTGLGRCAIRAEGFQPTRNVIHSDGWNYHVENNGSPYYTAKFTITRQICRVYMFGFGAERIKRKTLYLISGTFPSFSAATNYANSKCQKISDEAKETIAKLEDTPCKGQLMTDIVDEEWENVDAEDWVKVSFGF